MLTAVVVALVTALALSGALAGMLFWQLERSAKSADLALKLTDERAELKILLAADSVALADKERALNLVIAERDRLLFTLDTVEDQRDELLKEALEHATPGTIAISVRDALKRLRVLDPKEASDPEALPNVPRP